MTTGVFRRSRPVSPGVLPRRFWFWLAYAVPMLLLAPVAAVPRPAAAEEAKRIAILIANATYPDASLPQQSAVKDAELLAEELRHDSFEIDLRTDLNRGKMRAAVDGFLGQIKPGTTALVYFNGIGIQVSHQTYLIPTDAEIWSEADVKHEGVSVDGLVAEMSRRGASVKIVIIDAARRNPFERRFRAYSAGLAGIDAPDNTLVMYAAAPNKVEPDGTGDVSLFMNELVKEMRTPNISAEDAIMHTRVGVSRASNGEQVPWFASSLIDQIYFGPSREVPNEPAPQEPPPPPATQSSRAPEASHPPTGPTASPPAPLPAETAPSAAGSKAPPTPSSASPPPTPSAAIEPKPAPPQTDQAKPDQAKPDQAKPDQAKPDQAKSDQAGSQEARGDGDKTQSETPKAEPPVPAPAEAPAPPPTEAPPPPVAEAPPSAQMAPPPSVQTPPPPPAQVPPPPSSQTPQPAPAPTPPVAEAPMPPTPAPPPPPAEVPPPPVAEPPAAAVDDKPGTIFRDCPDCPEMIVLPPGTFLMGSGATPFDRPPHRVTIARPIAMARSEVTFDDWERCTADGACAGKPDSQGFGEGQHPVINVSWSDAKAFVAWLAQKTGKRYRLPTEAEWEYAARGGTNTAFSWGSTLGKGMANCNDCGGGDAPHTTPVRSFPANGYGLYDMAGNAAEWVEDCWNASYRGAPKDGSAWLTGNCEQRVLRGGSFDASSAYVKPAARFRYDSDVRYWANGFRVLRELP